MNPWKTSFQTLIHGEKTIFNIRRATVHSAATKKPDYYETATTLEIADANGVLYVMRGSAVLGVYSPPYAVHSMH